MQIYWNLLKSMFAFKSYRRDENWGFEFPVSLLPCQPQCQGFAASNWESGRRTRQLSLQPFLNYTSSYILITSCNYRLIVSYLLYIYCIYICSYRYIYLSSAVRSSSSTDPVKNGDCGCQMVHLGLPESIFAKLTSRTEPWDEKKRLGKMVCLFRIFCNIA